jgi:hypothetical protein
MSILTKKELFFMANKNTLPERSEIEGKYKWNLGDMFASDQYWENELTALKGLVPSLAEYRGKLSEKDSFHKLFKEKSAISKRLEKLFVYARMSRDQDNSNNKYIAMADRAYSLLTDVDTICSYIVPELNLIAPEILTQWSKLPELADYSKSIVLARNRDIFAKMLKVAEIRYAAGKVPQQDVLRSQTELSILETRLVKLEQERAALQAQINALVNRKTGAPLGRPEEVTAAPFNVTVDGLLESAHANAPMLRREQKMVERSELAVNMARKEYYPDFAINAGYFNMGSMPPMYELRGDFRVPLYFWRKQRAGVAEQSSRLAEARRNYQAAGLNLEARIREDYTMAQASSRLMELYQKTVVPQASLTLESGLNSYQTGANDLTTVLASAGTILEYEMSYYDELRDYSLALARLEEMTAVPLTM